MIQLKIGSGTYGFVFKGENVDTKEKVAIKKVKMEKEREGFPVTAIREIKILKSLKNENIVLLHEVCISLSEGGNMNK